MARTNGTDGFIKVGATSNTAVAQVNSWTVNQTIDEFVRKPLGVAYSQRDTGHTDWTATCEVDLDRADAQLMTMLIVGAAITFWFYDAATTGQTGAGVILGWTETVGPQTTVVTINAGGNAAIAAI